MIYCPKCKTANRDGSRFCNECGEPFSRHTEVRCPNCGASNSIQSAFCGECGGRLLSSPTTGVEGVPTIKGLSLPTKASTDDDSSAKEDGAETAGAKDAVPSWLRELGSAGRTEDQPPEPQKEGGADAVPEWLQDLRASLPEETPTQMNAAEESEEVPDWLSQLRPSTLSSTPEMSASDAEVSEEVPGAAAEVPEEEEVPEWLAELRSAGGAPVSDTEEPEAAAEVPEAEEVSQWLAELRSAEGAPASDAELSEEAFEPVPEVPEAEEVPQWLADLRSAEQVLASEAEVSEEEPEVAPEVPELEEEPQWLADLRSAEEAPASDAEMSGEETTEPPTETPEEELPPWLAELRAVDEEPVSAADLSEPEVPAADVFEAPTEVSEELPPWLAALRAGDEPLASEANEVESDAVASEEPKAEDVEALAEPTEEETPEWLKALGSAAGLAAVAEVASEADEEEADVVASEEPKAEDVEPLAEPTEEETPEWLTALGSAAGLAAAAKVASEAGEEEADVTEPEDFEVEDVDALAQPTEEETPDWLAALGSAAGLATVAEVASEADEEEVDVAGPDLSETEVTEAGAPEPAEADDIAETVDTEDVPPWLEGIQPGEEAIVPEADVFVVPPESPEGEEGEAPEWLAEIPPTEETDEGDAIAAGAAVAAATVPGWLAELRPDSEEAPPVPKEAVVDEGELPEWLVPTEEMEGEALARAEIPDWLLALKPSELREGEPLEAPEEIAVPVEETGLLAGLSDTLPAEMLIVQPRAAATPVEGLEVVDDAHARLFAEIVGQPPAVMPTVVERPQSNLMAMLPRWIVYIVLIGVVALPIMLGKPLLPRTPAPVPAMVSDLYDSIASLSADAPVLVAFDYDPTTSGELDVLAQAIVGQLMDQETRIATVSLLPAGPPTAQSLLDSMASERSDYADSYGQRYVNLGYLPGQASAVWRMGQSMEAALPNDLLGTPQADLAAMEGISNLSDFDLVIELAASQNTLRWWVEQAVALYDIPLGAGVSAAIEPAARAYYETDPQQLVGLVAGVLGAASYESLSSDEGQPTDRTGARLDGQLGGHLIFVLVIVAGAAVYLARRGTGRER